MLAAMLLWRVFMRELTDYEIEEFDQTGLIPDTKLPVRQK